MASCALLNTSERVIASPEPGQTKFEGYHAPPHLHTAANQRRAGASQANTKNDSNRAARPTSRPGRRRRRLARGAKKCHREEARRRRHRTARGPDARADPRLSRRRRRSARWSSYIHPTFGWLVVARRGNNHRCLLLARTVRAAARRRAWGRRRPEPTDRRAASTTGTDTQIWFPTFSVRLLAVSCAWPSQPPRRHGRLFREGIVRERPIGLRGRRPLLRVASAGKHERRRRRRRRDNRRRHYLDLALRLPVPVALRSR